MWNEQKRVLETQLSLGEQLLWSGMPRQGFAFRKTDLYTVPFSAMWLGFAIFWESSVFYTNAPLFFRLWGIPFILVGIYMLVGRFFGDR